MVRFAAAVLATLSLGACADDSSVVEVGLTALGMDRAPIVVPLTVTVNTPFTVQLETLGDGCISVESTEVHVSDDAADITPYDRRDTSGNACIQPLWHFVHDVEIEFSTPGEKQMRITGRERHYEGTRRVEELVTYPYVVTVQ